IIPARARSKRFPGKNVKQLCGKPVFQWTVEAAQAVPDIDNICVSTDGEGIAELAVDLGVDVPFIRSRELSSDTASSVDVACDVVEWYNRERQAEFDYVILLQPTSPLRTAEHIRGAISALRHRDADAIVSVCPMSHSPLWANTLPENDSMVGFLPDMAKGRRSQDLPTYFRLNGAIYIARTERLLTDKSFLLPDACFAYRMPESASIDIDSETDFRIAEALLVKEGNASV
ncbi:MAG: cytidylyltransferase domain-containing protein, partial [Guyparkeria sp.]|uniref:acylneuraminate cytidylyltransferase family protein n=1 Tax=Guyparkeria sp. TaxID=2035736 RepID=UPI0039795752